MKIRLAILFIALVLLALWRAPYWASAQSQTQTITLQPGQGAPYVSNGQQARIEPNGQQNGVIYRGKPMTASPAPTPTPTPTPTQTPAPTPTPTPKPPPTPNGTELPKVYLNTALSTTPSNGKTISVAAGGNLQAAINKAQPGDRIELTAGAAYTGNFSLPNKPGASWITITTKGFSVPEGQRVAPTDAPTMAKLVNGIDSTITAAAGAHNYRFIGLEITTTHNTTAAINYGLVVLGTGATTIGDLPQNIIFDRVYAHGTKTGNLRRCFAWNSGATALIDSYVSDCHEAGADSQAIAGWSSAGPFKIVNNYLEGAGENILFGGAEPSIPGLTPADIEIRGNYFFKPLSWKANDPSYAGIQWSVKNLFEIKNAKRVLLDGNVFENDWEQSQAGRAIVLRGGSDSGRKPLCEDVTFTNNVLKKAGAALHIIGLENPTEVDAGYGACKRVLVKNNLFEGVSGRLGGQGIFTLLIAGPEDVRIDHNTVLHNGNIVTIDRAARRFIYTNNISAHNEYGFIGDGTGPGNSTINTYLSGSVIKKNVIAGGKVSLYPAGNFFPASLSVVGFTNYNNGVGGNYTLATTSAYKNAGTDGKDLGADFAALDAATACTITGKCGGNAAPTTPRLTPPPK